MKADIERLWVMANAPSRRILGLMSGTSLDGLDLALCTVSGSGMHTRVVLDVFESLPYSDAFRDAVRRVFARREIDQLALVLLHVHIAETHAAMVNDFLQRHGAPNVDVLASHGQTVFHAPQNGHGLANQPNATLQLGDGDHLAVRTGLLTVSDFRQKHVAYGGEGAPLALYGDVLLFSSPQEDRFLLNIGGIANFTFLQSIGADFPHATSRMPFAADTGPGNTLMDAAARRYFDVPFDRDGLLAARGQVLPRFLADLLSEPYFDMPFPKTTGPERFSWAWVEGIIARLPKGHQNPYDIITTLTELTAQSIDTAVRNVMRPDAPTALYLSGGGAYNPVLCRRLQALLPDVAQYRTDVLGIPADAKEAVLFAVLANETLAGGTLPKVQGLPWMSMGKVSLPG